MLYKYLSLTAAGVALGQVAYPTEGDVYGAPQPSSFNSNYNAPVQTPQQPAGMDPMMMMMLMGDGDKSMKSMLPLLMMSGGMSGGSGGMDPMMMMMLMGDDSDFSDMLPLMMMSGGMGGDAGAGGLGGMNPMMLMSLLGDDKSDCKVKSTLVNALVGANDYKIPSEDVASGKLLFTGADPLNAEEADFKSSHTFADAQSAADALQYVDYEFLACGQKDGGMGDLLPLMMMGGNQGGAGGMDPMMMMLMMGDGNMDDLLPLMMMGGMGGQQQQGGMNPMMLMMLMGDDKKTDCTKEYKLKEAFKVASDFTIEKVTGSGIADLFKTPVNGYPTVDSGFGKDFATCLAAPVTESNSSGMKDLLPFLMMNQQPGQAMDPMMMMMLMGDGDKSMKSMLPFLMSGGMGGGAGGMDPMMMMMLMGDL